MNADSFFGITRHSRVLVNLAGIASGLLGCAALLGWWLNNESLKSIVPGSSPMKPNIAAGMLLCGGALAFLFLTRSAKAARICAALAGFIVLVLGGLSLGEHFFGWNLEVDRWLIRPGSNEASPVPRMPPSTALCLVLTGGMFFAQSQVLSLRFRLALVTGLGAALAMIGGLALGGFSLELLFGRQWNLMGMSVSGVTGAVGFLLLGAGLLALLQSEGQLVWSLNGFTTMGFATGMLLVILAAAMAFSYTRRMLETTVSFTHRQEVVGKIQELYADISELASVQRIYLIIGDEGLLKAREQLKAKTAEDAASARKLTSDNPNQQYRLDQLERLLRQRIEWEEQVIGIRRVEGFPAAAKVIGTGKGVNFSAELPRLLNQMEQEESQLLSQDRKEAEKAATGYAILPFGVFLTVAVLALGLFFLNAGVTEQTQAEKALRSSEERMRTVLESALDSIIAMDHQGRIVEFNPAAEKTFGYQRSEAVGQLLADLIIPEALRARHQRGLSHYLATREGPVLGKRIEMTAMRADGSEFLAELAITRMGSQEPPMFTGFVRDITERQEGEEMLRASEERYRTLFESNPSPMWVYDLETLSFLAVNAAAIRHYGYSRDEFMAMTIKDIRPAEDLPALMNNLRQRIDGLDEVTQWRHRKKDGALIDVEITSHDLRWLGRPGSLVLINDVTARKRAEDQVLQVNAELEERVRRRTVELETVNKELESFSYSVSHDLRAPLRHIEGYVELVVRHAGQTLNEKSRAHLQTVSESVAEMGQLIDDLLDFSRMGKVEMRQTTIELDPIVGETIADLDREIRGRNVVWKRGPLPRVHADAALMKQVFVNLISNAVKYSRPRDPAEVEIGCAREENGEAVLFVRDNGVGFDMKYVDKLFGVFQRLHHADEFEGTGVGLASVQRIIARHGGRIWAEAGLDRGATFFFTLTKSGKRKKG